MKCASYQDRKGLSNSTVCGSLLTTIKICFRDRSIVSQNKRPKKMLLDQLLYLPEMYVAENELAFLLARLVSTPVEKIEAQTEGLKHKQPEAVINACKQRVSILTGPPGTGKTTTLRKIVDSFQAAGLTGAVVGPTGKASKRADEVINDGRNFVQKLKCSTTHSALEYDSKSDSFKFNRKNHLKYDYVIMDEFPMQELVTMRDFLESIDHTKTRVVFSGDQYQLPSVGPGNVGRDLINSMVIPAIELDVVLRTGPKSGVTYNANRILRGLDIEKIDPHTNELFTDFFFVQKSEEAAAKEIVKWISCDLPEKRGMNPLKDIQLMCPGKNGAVGTKIMNDRLRDILNPSKSGDSSVFGFRKKDKVINNRNNKKLNIVNGDVGFVKDIVKGDNGSHLIVDFGGASGPESNGLVSIGGEALSNLKLAYALTVHKSQGSEFPVAMMPCFKSHIRLLTRNLLYTGLTRAKLMGLITGDIKALRMAIKNTQPEKRVTRLSERIRIEYAKLKPAS